MERQPFLAATVAFEMRARLAGAEERRACLRGDLAQHALKNVGKMAADARGQGVRGPHQGFEGIVGDDGPGLVREIQSDVCAWSKSEVLVPKVFLP